jgi:signal transduction histidine kinase/ActR/RegA family two-component response regulator
MPSASSHVPPDTGSIRFKRLRLGVVALGVLAILAFAGSSAYDAWSSYRHTLAATSREIGNIANALAEQTAWTLQAVDLLLLDTARWYSSDSQEIPPERLDAALAIRAAGVPQVRQVIIVDSKGNQRFRSRGYSAPNHNVSDRSYFIAQRDGTAKGLFMSEPLVTRSEGRAGVVFSRRIDDENGRFAGVVTALVDLEDLNQFYRAVTVGRGGAVQLVRDDGTLLVRNPSTPEAVGKQFPALAAPAVRLVNPIDGQADFLAVAPVRNAGLRLAMTRESAIALQPWRDETIRVGLRTLVLALLGALTIVALLRQLRQIEAGERSLREREAQLRQSQKMEAIGTLAGGIAHDFNNILGAILGYGELALQHCAAHSELRRYLDNVMHATERAKLLVERILGFSRSGLGDRLPVNVQSVISETLELLAASLPAGVRLESRIEAGNAAVIGDATYLHQVAMNLCTNAVQAMERGGVLSVVLERCELNEPRTLSRGSVAPGPYLRLTVGDTGAGIPPAILERMFDPFFTTKGVGEGTGLGLSLVHGIVTDLGGAIDVTTTAGVGTRFDIWLPVAGETATPPVETSTALPRGNGETVMIVDDERSLVALAEEIIAELGYEPVGYDSSSAALEAFRAAPERFDIVLTDESMPDLVGTELAQAIRRIRGAIPIILMTGYGGSQLASRAADIGVNELLRKPLHRRELAESLARTLKSAP